VRHPLYRYPECVKSYDIAADNGGGWQTIAEVRGNYQRRRFHSFPPLTTNKVRVTIHETNGSPSARVYEVRLYGSSV
jgi:hypothetical protein